MFEAVPARAIQIGNLSDNKTLTSTTSEKLNAIYKDVIAAKELEQTVSVLVQSNLKKCLREIRASLLSASNNRLPPLPVAPPVPEQGRAEPVV